MELSYDEDDDGEYYYYSEGKGSSLKELDEYDETTTIRSNF